MRPRGFTLLELLVALAIAALGVGSVAGTLFSGARDAGRARMEGRALEAAREALAIAEGTRLTPATIESETKDGLTRVVTIRARHDLVLRDTEAALIPYQVDIAVRWRDGRVERSLSLSTLRLGGGG